MTVSDVAGWWVHTVTVETRTGTGADGPAYATATTVPCFYEAARKTVTGPAGDPTVSEATLYAPRDLADVVTVHSRVTIPVGTTTRVAYVVAVHVHDSGTLSLPDHVEVNLT